MGRKETEMAHWMGDGWLMFKGVLDIVRRQLGRYEEADRFFVEQLSTTTPWVRAMQLPTTFNARLATAAPQPFLDTGDITIARLLRRHGAVITSEFHDYEAKVRSGAISEHFDGDHHDSWMTEMQRDGEGDRVWKYLYLRHPQRQWEIELCKRHFPTTCNLFRGLPSVDGHLQQKPGAPPYCQGYCQPEGHDHVPGMVSFYRLAPGSRVPLHNGGNNQRIKCHLVIVAPSPITKGSASITVGGVRRVVGTGDVFCFDDSYVHEVHNGGGVYQNLSRVVFDVSAWHPKLKRYYTKRGQVDPEPIADDFPDDTCTFNDEGLVVCSEAGKDLQDKL